MRLTGDFLSLCTYSICCTAVIVNFSAPGCVVFCSACRGVFCVMIGVSTKGKVIVMYDMEKTRYAIEHEWWFFFVPTWSFVVLCTTGDEYDYVCDMVGRDNELSPNDALSHMVAQMVDFQDDGFRNYCDGLNIDQPLGDDYAKLSAEEIVSYYGAFVQSWGVPDFFDTPDFANYA